MKKLMFMIMVILALAIILPAQAAAETPANTTTTTPAQAEKAPTSGPSTTSLFLYAIYLGIVGLTAAAISGVFAQSKALRTAVENIGRNPSAADSIRGVVIIGLALIESLVIYVLLVNLILFFVKWQQYKF
ncbi:MAG: ATP synthase F0 subunit C [Acidobacteria bacterium]|jgi:F-type H+-transporting ATPase subunit c|nr:ATP synthase F0 subunit C [Acidobacteriota bacterium]